MKTYYLLDNVGKVKYTVNFSNGAQKNKDGSEFFDIQTFKNKKKRDAFVKELIKNGYKERY